MIVVVHDDRLRSDYPAEVLRSAGAAGEALVAMLHRPMGNVSAPERRPRGG